MKSVNLNVFVVFETTRAAAEMGLDLPLEKAIAIGQEIVQTRFPVCVRDYLKNLEPGE